jgi:hypothetical protein
MSAAILRIIERTEELGGTIGLDGNDLALSAPAPLPENLISEIKKHKSEIVLLLRDGVLGSRSQQFFDMSDKLFCTPQNDDLQDWQEWFEERAATLEYCGELDRFESERQALEATIIHWMNRTPPPNLNGDQCAQCGDLVGRIGNDAVPFLTGGGGHAWLHHGCHSAWLARRRREAIKALCTVGIIVDCPSTDEQVDP